MQKYVYLKIIIYGNRAKIVNIKELKKTKATRAKISKSQLERLKLSLQNSLRCYLSEIVVDENMMILGGNMIQSIKRTWRRKIPVKIIRGFTEEQKKEFIIKDNNN